MRSLVMLLSATLISLEALATGGQTSGGGRRAAAEYDSDQIENPNIDMPKFLKTAERAAKLREKRRISEARFLRMARDPNTIILDARSRELYDLLHVQGAMNLSFSDISIRTLEEKLPNKKQRILIYCNNNFENDEEAFPGKAASASLNISTFIALYTYGYRNVYELGPLLDVKKTKIPLVSTEEEGSAAQQ